MKHMPRLALSLEKDVDNGKVFLEDEHEFYVQFDNFDFLKNAESMDMQEQWSLKVEKTAKNDAKGQIRIRKVQEGSVTGGAKQTSKRPVQYVMTTKADLGKGPGKRMEVPIPTTADAFEVFARISNSGMIKHRYHFPTDKFVFEVDMFLTPDGEYCEYAKIDLEVKNREDEIPPFPFQFLKMVRGDSEDPKDRAFIRGLYDKYFLAPNKYIGEPSNENMPDEDVSGLGLEALTAEERNALPDSSFAFPSQRKMPLENASHVRNALARFNQVEDVSEADRKEAMSRIHAAAKKFGVEIKE
jgi:CYTH domain-containing protein